eukprot:CAMPEP_0175163328 /NCGR_PEP_ID=MMETSP0087-20121206/25691_1 /TAXON_ID=136419 /ORGANISM="Unknown Unknown, Strain D1" /LENGTH=257 /DNA_ID=CAMNT_0016452025 /DNA_START=18 /DNA_END=788 /DNA_ORIENTATION=+
MKKTSRHSSNGKASKRNNSSKAGDKLTRDRYEGLTLEQKCHKVLLRRKQGVPISSRHIPDLCEWVKTLNCELLTNIKSHSTFPEFVGRLNLVAAKAQDTIFREGDESDKLLVLVSGTVSIWRIHIPGVRSSNPEHYVVANLNGHVQAKRKTKGSGKEEPPALPDYDDDDEFVEALNLKALAGWTDPRVAILTKTEAESNLEVKRRQIAGGVRHTARTRKQMLAGQKQSSSSSSFSSSSSSSSSSAAAAAAASSSSSS